MTLHIVDDKELNARMKRVFNQVFDILEKEKFTAKDALWLLKTIEWEIERVYWEQVDD